MSSADTTLSPVLEGTTDALFDLRALNIPPDAARDAAVRVQWQDPASGRWMLHAYLDVGDASEVRIADLFGGGHYRCTLVVPDEAGRRVVRKSVFIRLPGPHRMPSGVIQPKQWASGGPMPTTPEEQAAVVRAERDRMDRMSPNEIINTAMVQQLLDLVRQRNESRASNVDWNIIVPAVTGLLGTVLTALLERSRDGGLAAKLEALDATLREMQRAGPTTHAVSDVARAVKELVGLREILQPAAPDGEGAMWNVALKALEALM
ncbi:MAG: hypothetical protein K6T59_11560, partial [Bryobacteraceae bacterium]|nr:hypothetical protein [Bryobacteraceae bacterium]